MKKLTVEDLKKIFANPFYAITIDKTLCQPHKPMVSKEDWIKANVRNIEENGPEEFLRLLLEVLEGEYV